MEKIIRRIIEGLFFGFMLWFIGFVLIRFLYGIGGHDLSRAYFWQATIDKIANWGLSRSFSLSLGLGCSIGYFIRSIFDGKEK